MEGEFLTQGEIPKEGGSNGVNIRSFCGVPRIAGQAVCGHTLDVCVFQELFAEDKGI
jgi:hypothetical protein